MLKKNMNASSQEIPNSAPPFLWKLTSPPSSVRIPPSTIITTGKAPRPRLAFGGFAGLSVSGFILFQRRLLFRRQIIGRTEPAQLQGAEIRDGRPAVGSRHQRRARAHQHFAVR